MECFLPSPVNATESFRFDQQNLSEVWRRYPDSSGYTIRVTGGGRVIDIGVALSDGSDIGVTCLRKPQQGGRRDSITAHVGTGSRVSTRSPKRLKEWDVDGNLLASDSLDRETFTKLLQWLEKETRTEALSPSSIHPQESTGNQ